MTSVLDKPVVVEAAVAGAETGAPAEPNVLKAKALHTALSDALLFASPASAKLPFLEVVRLEFGGGRLVASATDRFTLGISRVEYTGAALDMLLSSTDAKTLIKFAKTAKRDEGWREVTVEVAEGDSLPQVTFRFSTGESVTVRGQDYTPVKWRQLVPADSARMGGIVGMGYTPALLAKFTKVRPDEAGAQMMVFPSMTAAGRPGPTAIRVGEDFIGLLMPIGRAAGEVWEYERPGWVQEAPSVAAGGPEGGL